MARNAQSISTHFFAAIEQALNKYPDPQWLGENSVLASSYFLGNHLTDKGASSNARGQALQALLKLATARIEGKYGERYRLILRRRYFENRGTKHVQEEVGLAKNAYNESRKAAIRALEKALVDLVHPSLRLELPPTPQEPFTRAYELARLHAYLDAGQDITILGPQGSGKTTLTAQLAAQSERPFIWYTVRPGINDTVQSFAFALALFIHTQGKPAFWFELVAAQGQMSQEAISRLMISTLQALSTPLLLFIDDVDMLDPMANEAHGPLLQLLESIRPWTTSVYIGRRFQLDTDRYITLGGLSVKQAKQIFARFRLDLPSSDLLQYHAWTQGNPRLLHLCASLLSTAPSEVAQMASSTRAPNLELLLDRIVSNLSQAERRLLAELSIFRGPIPTELSLDEERRATFHLLQGRQIVDLNPDGGVRVAPIYRQFVRSALTTEAAEVLHVRAAHLRSTYGEFSSSIYHLLLARRFEDVIDLWPMVQQQEFEQGQAPAALFMFRDALESDSLTEVVRAQVHQFCGELALFLGNIAQAKADIGALPQDRSPFSVAGLELAGRIENDRGEFAEAQSAFEKALARADSLLEARVAMIHKGLAWLHLRQRDLDLVEHELDLAQFEIENMRGNLAHDQARYDDAMRHYEAALCLAEALGSRNAIAKTSLNLASAYMVRGRYDDCFQLLEQVYAHYEAMARISAMAGCRITMAVAHNMAGEHVSALRCLDDASEKLSTLKEAMPWQSALIDQARAEAFLGLGELSAATTHVLNAINAEDTDLLPDAYRTLGEVLTQQGRWADAEAYLLKSIDASERNEDLWLRAYALRALGKLHIAQTRSRQARRALAEAIELFDSMGLPNETRDCEDLLSIVAVNTQTPLRKSSVEVEERTGLYATSAQRVCRLTASDIRSFLEWRYEAPYDIYNLKVDDVDGAINFFLAADNGYFAVRNEEDALLGFCCYGFEGQVPGGRYHEEALDIGVGMRPALTGQGAGYDFVAAVLAHAEKTFSPQRLRATIARFNRRSQRVFERHGFRQQSSFFRDASPPREYVILIKEVNHGHE